MIPLFSSPGEWGRALEVATSWLGTPYRHLWMKKGRGADCSLFIGAILQELGIVSKVEFDFYPHDWYLHAKIEVIKDAFYKNISSNLSPGFSLIGIPTDSELLRGDIPCFSTVPSTAVTNHAGFMLDPPNQFIHSVRGRGVSVMNWGHFWASKTTIIYRVVSDGT